MLRNLTDAGIQVDSSEKSQSLVDAAVLVNSVLKFPKIRCTGRQIEQSRERILTMNPQHKQRGLSSAQSSAHKLRGAVHGITQPEPHSHYRPHAVHLHSCSRRRRMSDLATFLTEVGIAAASL